MTDLAPVITRRTPYDELPEWLTVTEVQQFLGISRNYAYELVRDGRLPSTRFGHLHRVPRSALRAQGSK